MLKEKYSSTCLLLAFVTKQFQTEPCTVLCWTAGLQTGRPTQAHLETVQECDRGLRKEAQIQEARVPEWPPGGPMFKYSPWRLWLQCTRQGY